MTRINIIPVEELTDQHLIAEYREIFMIGSSLQRSLKSKNWDPQRIPKEFKSSVGIIYGKMVSNNQTDLASEIEKYI